MAIAAATPYAYHKFRYGKAADIVVSVLRRRLGFLDITEETYAKFAEDYMVFRAAFDSQLTKLSILATPLRFISPYSLMQIDHPLVRLEDNIVSQFLLSTDFFQQGQDEKRKLNYLGFYDPSNRPCANPFHKQA